jgi:TolB protein
VSKAPAWSPAGGWIAFVSNQPGIDQIFRVGTDGHNLTQLTFDTSGLDEHPSWSPDGSRLVFSTTRGGPSQLWAMNADGSGQADLSNSQTDDSDPIWIK